MSRNAITYDRPVSAMRCGSCRRNCMHVGPNQALREECRLPGGGVCGVVRGWGMRGDAGGLRMGGWAGLKQGLPSVITEYRQPCARRPGQQETTRDGHPVPNRRLSLPGCQRHSRSEHPENPKMEAYALAPTRASPLAGRDTYRHAHAMPVRTTANTARRPPNCVTMARPADSAVRVGDGPGISDRLPCCLCLPLRLCVLPGAGAAALRAVCCIGCRCSAACDAVVVSCACACGCPCWWRRLGRDAR
jgi:hypothetical protein